MLRYQLVAAALVAALAPSMAMANSSAKCGGDGDNKKATLSCETGSYAVGITARGATYVDKFGIRCASFNKSGKRGALGSYKNGGSSGGSTTGSATCGADQAVTGISTRTGWYVDRITGGVCGQRTGGSGFAEFNPNLNDSDLSMSIGGSGGSPCDLQCAEGEAIWRVIVRYDAWIDSIEIRCKP